MSDALRGVVVNPRILVTGSRDFDDAVRIETVLKGVRAQVHFVDATLVHGDAAGADRLAAAAWIAMGGEHKPYRVKWSQCVRGCKPGHQKRRRDGTRYCPTAGHRRNQRMVDAGADLCLVFIRANSSGTRDCRRRAEAAGIPCLSFDYDWPAVEGVWS